MPDSVIEANAAPSTPDSNQPSAPDSNQLPGKSKSPVITVVAALLAVVAMGLAVFHGIHARVEAKSRLQQATGDSAIPYVDVVNPTAAANAAEIQLPGNTVAFDDTPIYARTSGYVKHWYVDIGAHVQQGQLLALIETPELDQQLEQARAELKNAQANLQIASITAARWQNLLKTDSVSQQETDQAVSDLNSKQALVDSHKANVDRLEQLQAFERVTAPFDGIITTRNTDTGALIQAGDNSAAKELYHLDATRQLRIYIPVPEIYAPSVKAMEKVHVSLDEFPDKAFTGTVVRNSDAIDASSRTLNVEVDIDNPSGQLFPGAYAFVHLPVPPSAGAVAIPSNALLFRAEGLRAGVVRNGRVELVPINIGQDYGSAVEVISGLSPKDAVVVNPSDSLASGEAVHVAGHAKFQVQ